MIFARRALLPAALYKAAGTIPGGLFISGFMAS